MVDQHHSHWCQRLTRIQNSQRTRVCSVGRAHPPPLPKRPPSRSKAWPVIMSRSSGASIISTVHHLLFSYMDLYAPLRSTKWNSCSHPSVMLLLKQKHGQGPCSVVQHPKGNVDCIPSAYGSRVPRWRTVFAGRTVFIGVLWLFDAVRRHFLNCA